MVAASRIIAVLDVGSHGIRIVFYNLSSSSPEPFHEIKVDCCLARGTNENSRALNPDECKKALATFKDFNRAIKEYGASSVYSAATGAVRLGMQQDPEGTKEFLRQAEENLGYKINIIPGTMEATLLGLGVAARNPKLHKALMLNLGGATLEEAKIDVGDDNVAVISHPAECALGGETLKPEIQGMQVVAKTIDKEMAAFSVSKTEATQHLPLVVPGNVFRRQMRVLAHNILHRPYKDKPTEGLVLDSRKATPILNQYARSSGDQFATMTRPKHHAARKIWHGILDGRMGQMSVGARVMLEFMKMENVSSLIFSGASLRDGIAYAVRHGLIDILAQVRSPKIDTASFAHARRAVTGRRDARTMATRVIAGKPAPQRVQHLAYA